MCVQAFLHQPFYFVKGRARKLSPREHRIMQEPDLKSNSLKQRQPDITINARKLFGIDSDMQVPAFSETDEHVPLVDETYRFDQDTTLAVLAGFSFNRRVMIQGYHGTGKTSHIEQVAARLNWPCVRVNLDGQISRTDLVGRDGIVLEDGKQITSFQEGILPWALQNPIALVFDEYDAGRADVMFVIQRILEIKGNLTLLDQNRVIRPHPSFRLFSTTNTLGLGDPTGLYMGTQQLNHAQLDRWSMVATLNYLPHDQEVEIILAKVPYFKHKERLHIVHSMATLASLTRTSFINGDLSTVMSLRTVLAWAENTRILNDMDRAFRLSFLNKCEPEEHPLIAEYYQRCFNIDLPESIATSIDR